jgi:PAS domain S-box-containing protein
VTDFDTPKNDPLVAASIPEGLASLESILCTEDLQRRPSRPPDYEKENRGLVALVSALADSPSTIFQTLAETILEITRSDSAGLSLLTRDGKTPDVHGERFYWPAIAGMWNPHVGGGTPRNFGPCGDVLDKNCTLLFRHFERRYPYLLPVIPAAEECLLVPFYVAGAAVGTIWAIMHSDRHNFDAEDDRVMASLGRFASSAYQALVHIEDLKIQVAEREKVEAEVRELANGLEAKIRRLVQANVVGIVLLTLEGAIIEANEAFLNMVQYSRDDLASGRVRWTDLTPAAWSGCDERAIAQLKATGAFQPFEKEYFRKNGSRVPVLVGGALFGDGGSEGVAFVLDLSEQKEAEAALRESEQRFRKVFEEGPLGLAIVGRDFRFIKINSAFCQMVGYAEAELVQKTFADITHQDDVSADLELAERLFKGEIPFYRMQKRYLKKDGQIIWTNLTVSAIRGNDDKPLYRFAMIEDITEVKRTQEEALARQKLESLGTLASGIAHDFNNLLGGVQAQAELALAEFDAGSPGKEELNAICELARRGSEIVRQLMIYAGKEGVDPEAADLSKTVGEMLTLLKVTVSKRAVIQADLRQDLPATRASASQIRQIAMNLITNASDAIGDRDGTVRVITRRATIAEQSAVKPGTFPERNCVALEVSDTGCGMSQETMARVFDPFFTTKSTGHGLGLAVLSGIVRGLGGAILLTSEPGKGTVFQILLPSCETTACATGNPMSAIKESTSPLESTGPRTEAAVLVVEDEDCLRQAVAKMLRKNGFEVFEAADGASAIDLLRANRLKVDVILLDLTIPRGSSQMVLTEAAKNRPDIRVILTSAYGPDMIASAVNSPQICTFIRKPYQLGDLVSALRNLLPPQGVDSRVNNRISA